MSTSANQALLVTLPSKNSIHFSNWALSTESLSSIPLSLLLPSGQKMLFLEILFCNQKTRMDMNKVDEGKNRD